MSGRHQQSVAHDYLRHAMERYHDGNPPNAAAVSAMRDRFHQLLDQDLAAATTSKRKKVLKALGVGGAYAFDMMGGTMSRAVAETFNDLVDIATGVRNRDALAPETPRTKQRTAMEDWEIAKAIVALEHTSDVTPELEKRILATTRMTSRAIRKMMDNMDQGRGSYDGVKVNIQAIKTRLGNGETWMIDDLLT